MPRRSPSEEYHYQNELHARREDEAREKRNRMLTAVREAATIEDLAYYTAEFLDHYT